jgi:hypothetical protein
MRDKGGCLLFADVDHPKFLLSNKHSIAAECSGYAGAEAESTSIVNGADVT